MDEIKKVVIGLTGSIGMGKTTTANMFAAEGVPVWDADAAVHELYAKSSRALAAVAKICPQATLSGYVDREELKVWLGQNPNAFKQLEGAIHPLVAAHRDEFLETNPAQIVLLDIPLLFEMNLTQLVDCIVVASAPAEIQKQRVQARGTMTAKQFEAILAKQMPDMEKRKRADFIVETTSLEHARAQVQKILRQIQERLDA